jgi:hypothetical protein
MESTDWDARLSFVRDVLYGVLLSVENRRVYPDEDLIRRALALLELYIDERPASPP